MSPYDVTSLRQLSDYIKDHPEAVVPDPPRSIYQGRTSEPPTLAGCITESDLAEGPNGPHVTGGGGAPCGHERVDWSERCCWCNKEWKLIAKLLVAARQGELEHGSFPLLISQIHPSDRSTAHSSAFEPS